MPIQTIRADFVPESTNINFDSDAAVAPGKIYRLQKAWKSSPQALAGASRIVATTFTVIYLTLVSEPFAEDI